MAGRGVSSRHGRSSSGPLPYRGPRGGRARDHRGPGQGRAEGIGGHHGTLAAPGGGHAPRRGIASTLLPLRYGASQYGLYLAGCVLFAVGATCFIEAGLGTDPLDVFALGLRDVTPLTVGLAQGAFAALMLAVWAGLERRVPSLWPFVTFFFCGSMIDLWLHAGVLGRTALPDGPLMLVGVGLCARSDRRTSS